MTTYEDVEPGCVVLGHDGESWGVSRIVREPQFAVTLVRFGRTVTGYPPSGTPVTVLSWPERDPAEVAAVAALSEAFGPMDLIEQRWEGAA